MRVTAEGKRRCENWEKRPQRLKTHCWASSYGTTKVVPSRGAGAFTQILDTLLHEERTLEIAYVEEDEDCLRAWRRW
jgi:hypothetical protein